MSGYFHRLLARSARPRAEIHPLARLPQAGLYQPSFAEPELRGGPTEIASRPDRLEQPPTVEQSPRHEQVDGAPHIAVASERFWPTASTTAIAQPGVATPHAAVPPPLDAAFVNEVLDVKHSTQPPAATQVAAAEPGRTPTLPQDVFFTASTAFRLMPNQRQPKLHQMAVQDAAAPLPTISISPPPDVTQARLQAAQLAMPAGQRAQPDKTPDKTEVHVSIGRIEVTAMPAPAPIQRAPMSRSKTMSLDEYLRQRQQGRT